MHGDNAPQPAFSWFDLTLPTVLDMTFRYHRFRQLPEHPELRPILHTAVDTMLVEVAAHGTWLQHTRTRLLKTLVYHVLLRRLKVLQLSPDATLLLLRTEIRRSEEEARQWDAAWRDHTHHPGINPDLVAILLCPVDKQPLTLITDANQHQWLINPRNGYCYPVEDGIPILLKEEGKKHQNPSFIA